MNQEQERKVTENIRAQYVEKNYKATKLEQLQELDGKVRRPAEIFAYVFGTVGSLVLGTGMCLAMGVIGASLPLAMPLGIAIGGVGIAMVSTNYFIYKGLLNSRKKRYAKQVLQLSDELLNA